MYQYFLRNLTIDRPNHVWTTDITYISIEKGFVYLAEIMDWTSRKRFSWRLSNTLDTDFCIDAFEEALDHFGMPDIFNTDQGVQYTSKAFTDALKNHHIKIRTGPRN